MAKKESTLINMTLTLLVITVISAFALSYVNQITLKPKEQARMNKKIAALKEVLPEFDNNPMEEMYKLAIPNSKDSLELYPASLNGENVGVAVSTISHKGFGGDVKIMVGLLNDESINAIKVVDHKETPGFGTKMDNPSFKSQLYGKVPKANAIQVTKDGGEIDAITGATISSRAFCDAIQTACNTYNKQE